MALHDVKVTRLELTRVKARRKIAEKGLTLLKSKRGALITEFFKQIIKLQDIRINVADETKKAIDSMKIAEAYNGRLAVEMAAVEQQKANVLIKVNNIMGIKMPDIEKSKAMQTNSYEVAFFPSAIADAKEAYERLFSFLIDVAEKLYMPNIVFKVPLEFMTWDYYIMVCTVARNAIEWFSLYSQPIYSKRAFFYGVVEGSPLCPEYYVRKLDDKLVVPSNFCKNELEKIGVKGIKIVRHGIDPNEFNVQEEEVKAFRQRFPDDAYFIYYVASGDTRKGIDKLLEAVKTVNQKYKLFLQIDLHRSFEQKWIAYRDKLKLENRVFMNPSFGNMTRHEIAVKMNAQDLFYVHPATSEGFGLGICEGMACGKTPITCDAPPMNEHFTEKEGYKIPYTHIEYERHLNWMIFKHHMYNPKDLADTIIYAIEHPEETKEKGLKAKEKAQKEYHYMECYKKFLTL